MKKILDRPLESYQKLNAYNTAREILQQPELWGKAISTLQTHKIALSAFLKEHLNVSTKIIFTGAGTSEFVGNAIAPYITKHLNKKHVYSISSTDLVLSPEAYINEEDDILLISCARSGDSPESMAATLLVEEIASRTSHIFLTCNNQGTLAKISTEKKNVFLIYIENANDLGFAMTGSFTCMTLLSSLLFQLDALTNFSGVFDNWCASIEKFIQEQSKTVKQLVALKKDRIICLGSEGNKGIAQEAHLKALELSASQNTACYDSPLGFRHGPKSVLNDNSIVFVYLSPNDYTLAYEKDLLKELMKTAGNHHVVSITPQKIEDSKAFCHTQIVLPTLPSSLRKHMQLHFLSSIVLAQMYALENSIVLGVPSDNPSPSGSINRVVQGVTIYPYNK